MLDYGAIPPEINSVRMYSGAGSASLEAAASAWNGLAAELNSAATGYDTVITQLASDEWLGPASTSMADAAAPYVAWMNTTASQAEQAATQARAAAAAYEQAFAATVPPPVIAANRAQTAQLMSTNVLGQNTPAIAQLEAQYGEMWAQDATAMYTYAGQSAAATKVTPFDPPAQTTNPAGQAMQSAALTQAASTATGTSAQSTLSQAMSSLNGLQAGLASPTFTPGSGITFPTNSIIGQIINALFGVSNSTINAGSPLLLANRWIGPVYNSMGLPYFWTGMSNTFLGLSKGLAPAAAPAILIPPGSLGAGLAGPLGHAAGLGGGVSAGLRSAVAVGGLSAPPSWIGGGAQLTASATPLPISTVAAAPEHAAGNLLGGMPLPGAGAGGHGFGGPRYGFRPTVMARPPFAG